jgi:hypothetical protein
MHKTLGQRDPASAFPLAHGRDDADERRQANRAVAVSAVGLGATGLVELLLAVVTGSVGLLGDAIHNLSDVSTSAVIPARCSSSATNRHPVQPSTANITSPRPANRSSHDRSSCRRAGDILPR